MLAAAALALALQAHPAGLINLTSPGYFEVTAPVDAVFNALAARSAAGLEAHFEPSAQLTVVEQSADGTSRVIHLSWREFAGGLEPGPEKLEELMVDPTVAVDGDMAMVWGRYAFRIDGRLSHCGIDHFNLVRRDGVWRISSLTWTQRTTDCEEIEALTATD